MSPDAFIQLSLQAAYFRMHGTFVGTYESVTTRAFARGRTETGRTVTAESVAFVQALCRHRTLVGSSTKTHRLTFRQPRDVPLLVELLRQASAVHVRNLQECAAGKGVDRHALALRAAERELGLPAHPLWSHDAVVAVSAGLECAEVVNSCPCSRPRGD